ncbi:MAG: hypothetical protein EBV03_07470 [Proteobacteria bacterium]|nr:hypothetical protein [Pseudomonadota bacterium]
MWRSLLLLATLLLPLPATAQTQAFGERTQETIPVGNNRFLIFVGAPDGEQTGYTVDLIQVQDGMPFYVPLFIEDFDPVKQAAKLSYGVAFFAKSYLYDRATNTMNIRATGSQTGSLIEMRYRLDGDIFHLLQVTSTTPPSSVPQVLYKASAPAAAQPKK